MEEYKICQDTGSKGKITYKGCGMKKSIEMFIKNGERRSRTCKECTNYAKKIIRIKEKYKNLGIEDESYQPLTKENLEGITLADELEKCKIDLDDKLDEVDNYIKRIKELEFEIKDYENEYNKLTESLGEKDKIIAKLEKKLKNK